MQIVPMHPSTRSDGNAGGQAHPRVVIIGGGFGGLDAAQTLRHAEADVVLVDRRNFHLFQPLLYQVATGGLAVTSIIAPLRSILKRQRNVEVLLAEVADIDVDQQRVIFKDGNPQPFDMLIVATGTSHNYFGHSAWENLAPGLKTIEDASEIRRRVLSAFEYAERNPDPAAQRRLLTFVVVGGGPTGVELAGALAEIARYTMRNEFRRINPASATILLVEGLDRVLPTYPSPLPEKARKHLEKLGVHVRTGTLVEDVEPHSVTLKQADRRERIATDTVLWAAGVKASHLGVALSSKTKIETDRAGRVFVLPDLSVPGHPNIFVIGDLAVIKGENGEPLPGVAPVAIQEGRFVANLIRRKLAPPRPAFRYRNYGNLATIGRAAAVVDLGGLRFDGLFGWLFWLFVHLMKLVRFENRLLVFVQWAYSYLTWSRMSRIITEPRHESKSTEPQPLSHVKSTPPTS